jgi:hypothetical protein
MNHAVQCELQELERLRWEQKQRAIKRAHVHAVLLNREALRTQATADKAAKAYARFQRTTSIRKEVRLSEPE